MAKTKQDLIIEAKALGLDVNEKNTVVQISHAIEMHKPSEKKAPKEAEAVSVQEPDESATRAKKEDNSEFQDPKSQILDPVVKNDFTKAGKHSKKAAEEEEAVAAKAERKQKQAAGELEAEDESAVKKGPAPKVRSVLERRGKKYRKAVESFDKAKLYTITEAIKTAQVASTSKFDGSIELHINLNVDPKYADQNIRGSLVLPHGSGKTVRVAVFADEENVAKAKAAGADGAYGDDFVDKMKKNEIDFDILISTPQNMPKLAQFARVLGPKGLMPNPKSGTVTTDIEKAVKEAKAGRVEYRVDKSGIVHLVIGKVSFDQQSLVSNAEVVIQAIKDARPTSIKSEYIRTISVSPTMGPAVKVQIG